MRRVAIVHPGTLLGTELVQRGSERSASLGEIALLSSREEEVGELAEVAGGAAFVGRADAESLEGLDLVFFCGAIDADREVARLLPGSTPAIFLSPGATADDGQPAVAGIGPASRVGHPRLVSPHPAAVALSLLLAPLERWGLRRALATVALPVSAVSETGIDELFEETKALLTFQNPPSGRRGRSQLAFNLIPDAGAAERIEDQARAVLGRELPLTVQPVRAGVFHGLALHLWAELAEKPATKAVRAALGEPGGCELSRQPAALGPVSVAGGERLVIGAVRSSGGGYGVWAVMDNLVRGGALNALDLAAEIAAAGDPA